MQAETIPFFYSYEKEQQSQKEDGLFLSVSHSCSPVAHLDEVTSKSILCHKGDHWSGFQ